MPLTMQERHALAHAITPALTALSEVIGRLEQAHHDATHAKLWNTDRWHEVSLVSWTLIEADTEIVALKAARDHIERARIAVMNSDGGVPA